MNRTLGLFSRQENQDKVYLNCVNCPLYNKIRVPPEGNYDTAEVIVIGEAPGMLEIKNGIPFCGLSGKLLRETLDKVGFDKNKLFIINAVQCHPEDDKGSNRTPSILEIQCCRDNLISEIRKVKNRKLIILVGSVPLRALLHKNGINKYRGMEEWNEEFNCWVIPTFHPAAILRDINKKQYFENDLKKSKSLLSASKREKIKYLYPHNLEELENILNLFSPDSTIAFDIETNSLSPFKEKSKILMLSLSDGNTTAVIPLYYKYSPFSDLELVAVVNLLHQFFTTHKNLVAHNGKFDSLWLDVIFNIDAVPTFDTMIAQYLLNEQAELGLKRLASQYTNLGNYAQGVTDFYSDLEQIDAETVIEYSAMDAYATHLLYEKFKKEIEEQKLKNTLQMVMHFSSALVKVEKVGIGVDVPAVEQISNTLQNYENDLLKRIKSLRVVKKWEEINNKEFNPNSHQHLADVLFNILQLPVLEYTDKNKTPSTRSEVIRRLAPHHELPRMLSMYAKIKKLTSTFINEIKNNISHDNRIHTNFHLTSTVSGRLSSSDPNLQNIPARENISFLKRSFVPDKGNIFINFDYSQIELRVLASLSKDPNMCLAYQQGIDIHTYTAQKIFNKTDITKEERQYAKSINFGLVYGMSPVGLSKRLNISEEEANKFMQEYFHQYPKVKEYMDQVKSEVLRKRYVRSPLGRYRRFYDEIDMVNRGILDSSKQNSILNGVIRKAINFAIQATASDITQLALYRIIETFKKLDTKAKVVLTVHDSILVECPEEELFSIFPVVKSIMENINLPFLIVPLEAEAEVGYSYANLVPFSDNVLEEARNKFISLSQIETVILNNLKEIEEKIIEIEE